MIPAVHALVRRLSESYEKDCVRSIRMLLAMETTLPLLWPLASV